MPDDEYLKPKSFYSLDEKYKSEAIRKIKTRATSFDEEVMFMDMLGLASGDEEGESDE